MATPNDNTEVMTVLRDFENNMMKSITPLGIHSQTNSAFMSKYTGFSSDTSAFQSNIATKLDFSSMEETHSIPDSSFLKSLHTPDSLKRKVIALEAELKTSKAKLKERESFISIMEPANKQICDHLEAKLERYRRQSEIDAQTIHTLQGNLNAAKQDFNFTKNRILELEQEKNAEIDKLKLRINALTQESASYEIELETMKSEIVEIIREHNVEIGRLNLQIQSLEDENEKSQELIQTLKKENADLSEKTLLYNSLQKSLKDAEYKIRVLENQIESEKDSALIVKSKQLDLNLVDELKKENQILKEEFNKYKENNIYLLQEKVWSLQEKLDRAEKKLKLFDKLQIENEKLNTKLSQWEELFGDKMLNTKSPLAVSRKLSQYQKNEALIADKLSQKTAYCDTLEKQKNKLEETVKFLNKQLQHMVQTTTSQESLMKKMQNKISILTKERDGSRKILNSYLSDATIAGVSMNADYLKHIEETNSEYKKALEANEKEIEALNQKIKALISNNNTKIEALTSEIKKLREENVSDRSCIAELEKEKSALEKRISEQFKDDLKGGWKGKVLHFKSNPLEKAHQKRMRDYQEIQDENDQLKKRIKVLEEEGIEATDVTIKVQKKLETEGSDSKIKSLQEKLIAAEKQQNFILENARTKSKEFREAVYRLTGYRIDMLSAENFKLFHMYADSKDDYLLFKISSDSIQLIETPYSHKIIDKVEVYLQQYDSFPAFLSSITMDLFHQK